MFLVFSLAPLVYLISFAALVHGHFRLAMEIQSDSKNFYIFTSTESMRRAAVNTAKG